MPKVSLSVERRQGSCRITLRQILVQRMAALPKRVIVATSGDVDSSALVVACMEAGRDVTVTSFRLDGRPSSDFVAARHLAHVFGLKFLDVVLPVDAATICNDVVLLIRRHGARKKTAVECLWPFLYVMRTMAASLDLGSTLVVGSGADGHFALSKRAMIHFRSTVASFQAFRSAYFANDDPAQRKSLARLGTAFGVDVCAPYFDPRILALWSGLAWSDVNKPRQKEPIRAAFPELNRFRLRPHVNLQLGDSGIAEVVGRAALAKFAPNARSAVAAYNRIARGA